MLSFTFRLMNRKRHVLCVLNVISRHTRRKQGSLEEWLPPGLGRKSTRGAETSCAVISDSRGFGSYEKDVGATMKEVPWAKDGAI